MWRFAGYALIIIGIITLIIWGISQFIQPILPESINSAGVLLFAALVSTIGVLAGFKDTIELIDLLNKRAPKAVNDIQHNLPQPDYERFIGRQKEIEQIQDLLSYGSRHFVISIDGVGGVGKTALALEVASIYLHRFKRLSKKNRFHAIVWSTAKKDVLTGGGIVPQHQSLHTLEDIYSAIAVLLKRQDILNAEAYQRDDLIRHALTQQRTLLIIDNLETVDDERIMSFIRDVPAPTKIIVTTRHRIDVAYPIRLMGMNLSEAEEFLRDECRRKGVALTESQANKLIKRTGGIPLAIVWSIAQISFGHNPENVLDRLGWKKSDVARFCFEGVIEQIRGQPAYRLLMALAYLDNDIDRYTLGRVASLPDLDRDEGLVMLEKLSLVNKREDTFYALPLTLAYSKDELQDHPEMWLVLTEPYLDRYREQVRRELSVIRVLGLNVTKPISEIFVSVSVLLRPRASQLTSLKELQEHFGDGFSSANKLEQVNIADLIKDQNRVFVLGKPGSGKTTLLKYLGTRTLAEETQRIPVFVNLRDFAASGSSLFDYTVQQFQSAGFPAPEVYVSQLLETGTALFLLDGLDEVLQSDNERDRVINNVERFARTFSKCQVVVTSRIAATDYIFPNFIYVEMADFGEQEVTKFVRNWFHDNPQIAEEFLHTLNMSKNESLREFVQNPFLLSLLCLIFSKRPNLPDQRVLLYEESVDALLERWDAARGIRRDSLYHTLSTRQQRQLLAHIAASTFAQGQILIREHILEELIVDFVSKIPEIRDAEIDSSEILKNMESQHGLIVERSRRIYSFITLSFHEYFTARYFVENSESLSRLTEHVFEPRWKEVFLLTSGMFDLAEELFDLLLKQLEIWLAENPDVATYFSKTKNHTLPMMIESSASFNNRWNILKSSLMDVDNQNRNQFNATSVEQLITFIEACDIFAECLTLSDFTKKGVVEDNFLAL